MTSAMTSLEEAAIDMLQRYGSDGLAYSGGRPALDHLAGTCQILRSWNLDEAVCIAGLCHNLYGTRFFPGVAPLSDRARVAEAIGEGAERLVYLFCTLPLNALFEDGPPLLDGDAQPVSVAEHQALLHMLLANTLDQFPVRGGIQRAALTRQAPMWMRVQERLAPQVRERWQREATQLYRWRLFALMRLQLWDVMVRLGFGRAPEINQDARCKTLRT